MDTFMEVQERVSRVKSRIVRIYEITVEEVERVEVSQLPQRTCRIFHSYIIRLINDLHLHHRLFFPTNGEQAEVIVHHRTFDPVLIRRREIPGRRYAARRDVVDRITTRILDAGDLAVMHITRQKENTIRLRGADQIQHALLLMRKIGPGFIAVEFDRELRATTDESNIGRLLQLSFQPTPLLGTEQCAIRRYMRFVIECIEIPIAGQFSRRVVRQQV